MRFTSILTLALPVLALAAPQIGSVVTTVSDIVGGITGALGGLGGGNSILGGVTNGQSDVNTGSVITIPLLPGVGGTSGNENTCKCGPNIGTFCGYQAHLGQGDTKPLIALEGGFCDPLKVYQCDVANEIGTGVPCVLCLPSLKKGVAAVGKDTCVVRLGTA